jgi:ATP-dependent DNA helicase PIF1
MPNIIEATILSGSVKGEDVFIPRIPLIPSDMPFDFRRLQYPARLSFAMAINKAQGQSLSIAGVNLESSCFSHGQLYVACSRILSLYLESRATPGISASNNNNPRRDSSDEPWPAEQPPLAVFPDCTRRYWVDMWSAQRIPQLHFQLSKPVRYFFIQVTTQFIRSRG